MRESRLVQHVVTALALAVVPVLASHRILPTVLALAAAVLVPRWLAVTLLAFALPSAVGLPWPTHCLTAWAAWLATRPTPAATAGHALIGARRRATTLALLTLTVLLGLGAGVVTTAVARDAISRMVIFLPFGAPTPATLTLFVLAAAAVNATGEELMWRRFLPALDPGQPAWRTLAVQALSFGLAHWHGIPSGPVGAVCAGIYSLALYAVWRTLGFRTALLAHALTDVIIFGDVVRHAALSWSG